MQWCLAGLYWLFDQDFKFSISERMRKNQDVTKKNDNNIIDFYESTGYIRFEEGTHALSKQIYVAYKKWCEDNLEKPFTERTFSTQLKWDEKRLGVSQKSRQSLAQKSLSALFMAIRLSTE